MVEKLLPFPEMETERLTLRKFSPDDLKVMFEITSDAEVARYMNWQAHESIEKTSEILGDIRKGYETGDSFRWAIALKASNRFIGYMNVKPVFLHNRVNVGYWIGRPYWGRGYMTEALVATIRLCFEKLGVNRIEAEYFKENIASGRVMEKAGMAFEGLLRQYCHGKDGKYHDCIMYSITSDKCDVYNTYWKCKM
jgi:[ribosomal protein S5]-alanine N-acetyltransferase